MEVLILRYIHQGVVPSTGNLETVLLLLTHTRHSVIRTLLWEEFCICGGIMNEKKHGADTAKGPTGLNCGAFGFYERTRLCCGCPLY